MESEKTEKKPRIYPLGKKKIVSQGGSKMMTLPYEWACLIKSGFIKADLDMDTGVVMLTPVPATRD